MAWLRVYVFPSLMLALGLLLPIQSSADEEPDPAALDAEFQIGAGGEGGNVYSIDYRHDPNNEDARILLGGSFWEFGGEPRQFLAVLDGTGALVSEQEFSPPSFGSVAFPPNQIDVAKWDSEGRIVVGGRFSEAGGQARGSIARLNADGSLDTSFNPPAAHGRVRDLAILDDDSIVIVGEFTQVGDQTVNRIARLNGDDGSLDDGFGSSVGFNAVAHVVERVGNGDLLVGGNFTSYRTASVARLVRMDSVNGERVDSADFDIGNGFSGGPVRAIHVTAAGHFLVGGEFTSFDGSSVNRLVKLDDDGSQMSLNIGSGFNNSVLDIATDQADRIAVVGAFTQVNNEDRGRVARLLDDGSLDPTFDPAGGADREIKQVRVQNDGRILIGGDFRFYRSESQRRLARLQGGGDVPGPEEGQYNEWRVEQFGGDASNDAISGPGADPDGDGILNLHEYAFGGDPNVRNTATLPVIGIGSDNGEFFQEITFHFFDANDLVYRVQVSDDLGNWTDLQEFAGTGTQSTSMETVRDPVPVGSGQGRFLRVLVSLTEPAGVEPSGEFDAWRTEAFGDDADNDAISGPLADPDGDGVANLLEYAFDGNPNVPSSAVLPVQTMTEEGGETYMRITFHRRDVDDLVYRVQASDNLNDSEVWTDIWVSTENAFSGNSETVTDTVPVSPNNSRFLRVQVTLE